MRCSLAVAVLVAGCSSFGSASDSSSGSPTADGGAAQADAAAPDGGLPTCTPAASPIRYLDASFDGTPADHYKVGGIDVVLPSAPGSPWSNRAPAATAPNALWISAPNVGYAFENLSGDIDGGVCVLDASFDFELGAVPAASDGAIATIGVRNPAFDHCYVSFGIDSDVQGLTLSSHCGLDGHYEWTTVLSQIPSTGSFNHVDFHLDLAAAEAKLTIGGAGGTSVKLPLYADAVRVGGTNLYSQFGITGKAVSGIEIGLDSITVDRR